MSQLNGNVVGNLKISTWAFVAIAARAIIWERSIRLRRVACQVRYSPAISRSRAPVTSGLSGLRKCWKPSEPTRIYFWEITGHVSNCLQFPIQPPPAPSSPLQHPPSLTYPLCLYPMPFNPFPLSLYPFIPLSHCLLYTYKYCTIQNERKNRMSYFSTVVADHEF